MCLICLFNDKQKLKTIFVTCSLKWLIKGHTHLFLHLILGDEDTQDTNFTFQEGFQSSNDITRMKDKFLQDK